MDRKSAQQFVSRTIGLSTFWSANEQPKDAVGATKGMSFTERPNEFAAGRNMCLCATLDAAYVASAASKIRSLNVKKDDGNFAFLNFDLCGAFRSGGAPMAC